MDKQTNARKRREAGSSVFESVNQSILALAEHLAEYVSILKRTEGQPTLRTKQRA